MKKITQITIAIAAVCLLATCIGKIISSSQEPIAQSFVPQLERSRSHPRMNNTINGAHRLARGPAPAERGNSQPGGMSQVMGQNTMVQDMQAAKWTDGFLNQLCAR